MVLSRTMIKEYWTGFALLYKYCPIRKHIIKPQQLISVSNSFFIIVYWTVFQNWDFMEEVGGT